MKNIFVALVVLSWFGAAASSAAATLTVTNSADNGAGTLREAIASSSAGDTIDFADTVTGTIVLTSGELTVSHTLTLIGPGLTSLTVSGNNSNRVFATTNGTVTVSGLTLADGHHIEGLGGEIYNSSTLVLSNCTLTGNGYAGPYSATSSGGGIYNSGNLTVTNCTITLNLASAGGAIFNQGNALIAGSALVNNNAGGVTLFDTGFGGGIYNKETGTLRLLRSTLWYNRATYGGGVYSSGALAVFDSTIASNIVVSIDSTNHGSGIYRSGSGGGPIGNSIVAGNFTLPFRPTSDVFGASFSFGYNLIGATNESSGWVATDLTGSTNAPLNPLLGPWRDNGGPTFTMALLPGSPAIDAGKSVGPFPSATDQRGRPRPFDLSYIGNAAGGNGSDIGAFELVPPALNIAPSSTNVVLSWSNTETNYQLESTPTLLPATWTTVPGTPATEGNQFTVTNGPATDMRFYRLKSQ